MNKLRNAVCGLLLILLAAPLWAQWKRVLISGKSNSTDTPAPHPLSYFTANPFLRDDGGDFCSVCNTAAGRAQSAKRYTAASKVRPVGSLAGFRIVDVLFRVGKCGEPVPDDACWKSILVETTPGRYVEIYHLQQFHNDRPVTPSEIVRSGNEDILKTFMYEGGNGAQCFEDYWWFDSCGPHELDFSPVIDAVRKAIPPGSHPAVPCPFDVEQQEFSSGVQKDSAECHACDFLGNVTASFRLVGARAEPTEVDFTPDPK